MAVFPLVRSRTTILQAQEPYIGQNTAPGTIDQPGVGQKPLPAQREKHLARRGMRRAKGQAVLPRASLAVIMRGSRQVNPSAGTVYTSPNNPAPTGTPR